MSQSTSVDKAKEVIDVSRSRIESLIDMGRLAATPGPRRKPYVNDVKRLAEYRHRRSYVSLKENVDLSLPFAIAVQIASPTLGGSLYIGGGASGHGGNHRSKAIGGLGALGIEVPGKLGIEVTGWWPVRDEEAELAVSSQALIFGITGGIVFEAAQIVGPYYQDTFETGKAFPVRPVIDEELDSYIGYIEKTGQLTTYVQL